ncbi:hypothetical protein H5410_043224 [Solanum commersonii]|uniref:Uncharacterized protein n=1 Tax=Solanum commersonii TaxID=4109 RepID=A0A9J5Y0T1_SOLCO|nr:hypothetical protein H5410_043224 [Solanum commersonii]
MVSRVFPVPESWSAEESEALKLSTSNSDGDSLRYFLLCLCRGSLSSSELSDISSQVPEMNFLFLSPPEGSIILLFLPSSPIFSTTSQSCSDSPSSLTRIGPLLFSPSTLSGGITNGISTTSHFSLVPSSTHVLHPHSQTVYPFLVMGRLQFRQNHLETEPSPESINMHLSQIA